jgi:hypothetical protein
VVKKALNARLGCGENDNSSGMLTEIRKLKNSKEQAAVMTASNHTKKAVVGVAWHEGRRGSKAQNCRG